VTIVGPVAEDPSWQARAGEGFDKGSFAVDWERRVVTCPAGKESISWLPNTYPQNGQVFEARFARKDCTPCPFRAVHEGEAGAADHRAAGARASRGVASGSSAAGDRGVPPAVRGPGRDRRDA
jgi:hypothetical protein